MDAGRQAVAVPTPASPPSRTAPKKPLFKFKRQASATNKTQTPVASGDRFSPSTERRGIDDDDDDDDRGLDLFRRSKHFFPVIIEDQLARPKAATTPPPPDHRDRKRRKVSADHSDTDLYDVSDRERDRIRKEKAKSDRRVKPEQRTTPGSDGVIKSSPRSGSKFDRGTGLASPHSLSTPTKASRSNSKGSPLEDKHIIALSSSDDEDVFETKHRKPRVSLSRAPSGSWSRSPPKAEGGHGSAGDDEDDDIIFIEDRKPTESPRRPDREEWEESDDHAVDPEYAHFIAAARERQAAAEARASTPLDANGSPVPSPDDTVIKIITTSRLGGPEMGPIVVQRRVKQDIRLVRETVVKHAAAKGRPLTAHESETLFLTWKGRKVFDSATFASLGVVPDAEGVFRASGARPRMLDGDGFQMGFLHFEAWTVETYEEWQKKVERQRRRDLGELLSSDDEERPVASVPTMRVMLKSKHHDVLKMSVRPTTTIAVLVAAFRKQRLADDPTKVVSLYWDGEKLDEDTDIAQAEIEDMETIEVHIK